MSKKNIVVLGKTGQVASELLQRRPDWTYLDRAQLNLEDTADIKQILSKFKPEIVINAAAYTKVDLAEDESHLCEKINTDAVSECAQWCASHQAKLIHLSTDYVFDGKKSSPYLETDLTSPLNVYGKTKLLSEQVIAESDCSHTIFRTSWVYSLTGHNFLKTMLKLIPEKNLSIVFDQVGTPTYAGDIADLIIKTVEADFFTNQIYHYSHEGVASWYDFAVMIQKLHLPMSKTHISPILSKQYPQKAKRPNFSVLNKDKLKSEFAGLRIDHWADALGKISLN